MEISKEFLENLENPILEGVEPQKPSYTMLFGGGLSQEYRQAVSDLFVSNDIQVDQNGCIHFRDLDKAIAVLDSHGMLRESNKGHK